jgi:hypothetical protein
VADDRSWASGQILPRLGARAVLRRLGQRPYRPLAALRDLKGILARFDPFATPALNDRYLRISLKNPLLRRPRCVSAAAVSEAKLALSAPCGEDRCRKGDELPSFLRFWAVAAKALSVREVDYIGGISKCGDRPVRTRATRALRIVDASHLANLPQ